MPIWDGWQFLDAFKTIPTKQKIIIYILTSSNNKEDIERAKKYNLDSNYIIKPINLLQLKDIVLNLS